MKEIGYNSQDRTHIVMMSSAEFKAIRDLGTAVMGADTFGWAEYRAIEGLMDIDLSDTFLAIYEWVSLKMKTNALKKTVDNLNALLGTKED